MYRFVQLKQQTSFGGTNTAHSDHQPGIDIGGCFANVAVQQRLGLLPQRRPRLGGIDPDHLVVDGTALVQAVRCRACRTLIISKAYLDTQIQGLLHCDFCERVLTCI
jgi:hypothetical protein